jgi:hypothetical protein
VKVLVLPLVAILAARLSRQAKRLHSALRTDLFELPAVLRLVVWEAQAVPVRYLPTTYRGHPGYRELAAFLHRHQHHFAL